MKGLIFDIQGYAVHDGIGCRTLVFLSGCPLRCSWCANPEGQLLRPRLMYRAAKCHPTLHRCVSACPRGAIRIQDENGAPLRFDRSLCDRCSTTECVHACLSAALQVSGRDWTVDEVMRVLVRDQGFWGSRGGVTFSGGEPLGQPEFLLALLDACRAEYMHTAVETSACVSSEVLLAVLKRTDMLFMDIKHMDPVAHRAGTGVGNELILGNIEVTAGAFDGRLIIRVPVVPNYNDGLDNLQATAAFVAGLHLEEVNLLPFHRLAQSKYEQLGLEYAHAQADAPPSEAMRAYQTIFEAAGLRCYVGSETPF